MPPIDPILAELVREPVQAFFPGFGLILTAGLTMATNFFSQKQVGGQAEGQQRRAIEAQEREAQERREAEQRENARRQEAIDRYYEAYSQYKNEHRGAYNNWAGAQGSAGSGAAEGIRGLLGGVAPTPPPGHVMPGQAPAMGGGIGAMAAGPPPPTRPMRPTRPMAVL